MNTSDIKTPLFRTWVIAMLRGGGREIPFLLSGTGWETICQARRLHALGFGVKIVHDSIIGNWNTDVL